MNNLFKFSALAAALLLISCQFEDHEKLPHEFSLQEFSKVVVDGSLKVVYKKPIENPKTNALEESDDYRVYISCTNEQRKQIQVKSEEGILLIIVSDEINLLDDVVIEITSNELKEIRLKTNQQAIFEGYFDQDELVVVTEAKCNLILSNFLVNHLTCRTEGNSQVTLESYNESLMGDQIFDKSKAVAINDTTLLVEDSYLFFGDRIAMEEEYWVVYGKRVKTQFQLKSCNLITHGKTTIDASKAASKLVLANLQGESTAHVWAYDAISGNGIEQSQLSFTQIEGLDTSAFKTMGTAQINAVN